MTLHIFQTELTVQETDQAYHITMTMRGMRSTAHLCPMVASSTTNLRRTEMDTAFARVKQKRNQPKILLRSHKAQTGFIRMRTVDEEYMEWTHVE